MVPLALIGHLRALHFVLLLPWVTLGWQTQTVMLGSDGKLSLPFSLSCKLLGKKFQLLTSGN